MFLIKSTVLLLWNFYRFELSTINKFEYGIDWLVSWFSFSWNIFTCN